MLLVMCWCIVVVVVVVVAVVSPSSAWRIWLLRASKMEASCYLMVATSACPVIPMETSWVLASFTASTNTIVPTAKRSSAPCSWLSASPLSKTPLHSPTPPPTAMAARFSRNLVPRLVSSSMRSMSVKWASTSPSPCLCRTSRSQGREDPSEEMCTSMASRFVRSFSHASVIATLSIVPLFIY